MSFQSFFVRVLPVLALLLRAAAGHAQETPLATYTDAQGRYQLHYPRVWTLRKNPVGTEVIVTAGGAGYSAPAALTLTVRPLPEGQVNQHLLRRGGLDSLWRSLRRLPKVQVLGLSPHDLGSFEELRYDYLYNAPTRTHVQGRVLWRGGYELRLEYRAEADQDAHYLAQAQAVLASFGFTRQPFPSRRYQEQTCNNRFYGIAALRYHDGQWDDDCRTIHEFPATNLSAAPIIHRQVLPFQSYALALGFDNCLYSVTKAPTDAPEYVYRYNPATRQGAYTTWRLPAQGPDISWISGATDDQGNLFFMTSDANQLVRVSPNTGAVTPIWNIDPTQKAPYYPAIAFAHAGTHGNFCLGDDGTVYMVYSTDGSIIRVDAKTRRPAPEMTPLDGLPRRGGYSDLLMQNDASGRRRVFLAGPKALYTVDMARHHAQLLRRGTYTDIAGCNIFSVPPHLPPAPSPAAFTTWQGRVLNATTLQPLPEAELRLGPAELPTRVLLTPQATFTYRAAAGGTYHCRAILSGYLTVDSTWTAAPGSTVRDILLRPLAVGTTQQLTNVQFEQGQAVLLPTSAPALDQLARLLLDNPRMSIELRGHTDNVGPPEKNVVLSQQRAAAVKHYLVEHGVATERITSLGLGGAQPIAPNEEEATRKLNRRVEFRVTGMQ